MGFSAAVLLQKPVGRLVPFAKAGILRWEEEGESITLAGPTPRSIRGTDPLLGLGLGLELSPSWRARAEWERYEFDSLSSDAGSISLVLRF